MKKKIVMICCTALILSLVGCSSSADTGSEVILEETAVEEEAQESDLSKDASEVQEAMESTESQSEQSDSSMAIGQVSVIDGDTITVVLGEMSMNGGEAPSGEAPSGEAPSGEAPSGEAPSGEKPSGEEPSGETPSGEAPSGESPVGSPFTASDESITITFDGTVAIQLMTDGEITEGSIDDISVDDILSIAYDDSGAVASVQIMNQEQGGSKPTENK